MTAVLPEVRPVPVVRGRHRAPESATTGSMGVVPAGLRARGAHGPARSASDDGRAPLHRAARTAGLSLAALGALATAGGLATNNLAFGPSAPEAPATGGLALSPQLASADLALPAASHTDAATASVLPVVASASSAPAATPVKHDSPVQRAAARTAGQRHSAPARPAAAPQPAASSAASALGARALAEARSQIGVPYVWGGTTPRGFDCSGLMQWAYDQVGRDLPRTSAAQSRVGQSVSRDALQPGDLIFFNSPVSHVAMYAGNGQMIEAPTQGQDVKMSNLARRMDDVVGFRRL